MTVRRFVCICAFVLLLASVAALAGERVHFKNGYTLEVASTRQEGATVFLKLLDGGEIGVPQQLIENIEGGRPERRAVELGSTGKGARSPRSVAGANLRGVQNALKANRSGSMEMRGLALNAEKLKAGAKAPQSEVALTLDGKPLRFSEQPDTRPQVQVSRTAQMQKQKNAILALEAAASGQPLPEGVTLDPEFTKIPRPPETPEEAAGAQ